MLSRRLAMRLLILAIFAFICAAWAGPGSLAAAAGAAAKPTGDIRLVEIKNGDVVANLAALRQLEQEGNLKLAGREDGAGLFYAWDRAIAALAAHGIAYSLVAKDAAGLDLYLVPKSSRISRSDVEAVSSVLDEGDAWYVAGVAQGQGAGVEALPAKQLLPQPWDAGIPLRVMEAATAAPEVRTQAMTYSPRIQTLVDAVSQSNLYNLLGGLSGEHSVTIGGSTYTIRTRYSTTDGNKQAAAWLKEQYEALGIQAEYQYFNFRRFMRCVTFPVDHLHGWTVGASAILSTADGGQTWIKLEDGTEASLAWIFMLDNQTGWVVGSAGTALHTEDGVSWVAASTGVSNDLAGVFFMDGTTGWACGAGGTILKSTNGGHNWSKLTSGTTTNLTSIWFTGATDGWVVGAGGLIRRTTDGGTTWQPVTSPVTANLNGVAFGTAATGVATGLGGTILRTTDGATWQTVSSPVNYDLYSVQFSDAGTAWLCGYAGTVLASFDGGANWVDRGPSLDFQLAGIWFVSATEGWTVGNSVLLHTTDGGISWETQTDNILAGDVNVIATLPGTTHPERIYVICGHYDDTSNQYPTYAPGADDNGTGTIAALEAARVLSAERFEGTIQFVSFSREEQGLVGSGVYAQRAAARGDSIIGALSFDMIGYVDVQPEDVDIIYNLPSTWMGQTYEEAAGLYVPDLLVAKVFSPGMSSSDQKSFWDAGYCAFCGIEDANPNNPYYHRTTDRVSTLDFSFYTRVVKGAVAMVADGARIDSVTASVPAVASGSWLRVGPSPARGEVAIQMAASGPPARPIELYNVSGRLVKTLAPAIDGGVAGAVWHGDDASGAKVAAGIYFVRATGDERTAKVVLIK